MEVGFGIFLMVAALSVPILFLRFNGVNSQQYPEWIFCLGFLLFFLWMGSTLAFQSFEAKIKDNLLQINHNLRGPDLSYTRQLGELSEIKTGDASDETGKTYKTLLIQATDGATEVYRSVSPDEVLELKSALEVLRKSM